MSLNADEIKKIAALARLAINESDIIAYARDLSAILDLAEKMNAANTQGIEAMAHPLAMVQRLREDIVTEIDQRNRFQTSAPLAEAGLYLVPKVIE